MATAELRQSFRRRFRSVAWQIWSLHVGRGVAWTVLLAAGLASAIAAADYLLELSWPVRAGLVAVAAAITALATVRWVMRPAREWQRTRVAAELEGLFPRLGQRIRTATQHGGRPAEDLAREGVAPGLVAALEEETAEKVKPLPLQAALPVRPAFVAGIMAIAAVIAIAAASASFPEWRTALKRTALSQTSYTSLSVSASAESVKEGADVDIRATMSGRVRDAVVLHLREAEGEWRSETLEAADGEYASRLTNLRRSTEFFVTAGPERSAVRQIVVRHPLRLTGVLAAVTSPAYTGLKVAMHDSGSFSALQGSTAMFRFEFDRTPATATLVARNPMQRKDPPQRHPMSVQDSYANLELSLRADMEYVIEADDGDGMALAANRHRIRVTVDQPPAVWFESPGEGIEVHTLAEIMMRARARDDFGLAKIGIVFQVNNEEERTLVLYDVSRANEREAKAEQMLMLEQFLLTQKDCVAYYAFAEDARPDGPQRTTTELRFIDIRPFLRTFRLVDAPDEPQMGPQRDLILLDEVIARQRFNLNRTIRLDSRSQVRIDLAQVEKTAAFENKLATQTHDLGDFLARLGVDGAAILSQAEDAMLSAVDSLNNAKFATAINQERDALRYLMEARNTVQQALLKKPKAVRAAARAFDRRERQKLRRPNDPDNLGQLAEDLKKLADDEDDVARMLGSEMKRNGIGGNDPMAKPEPKGDKGMEAAKEKQEDAASRASVIDRTAMNAKGLTPLARGRISEGAKAANAGADALGQGDKPAARKEVEKARETLRAAAKQVAALAAEEAAQQLAMARDLANEIALKTVPLPDDPMKDSPGGGGEDGKKKPGLAGGAEDARTLQDVLEKLAASGAESDADAARKAAAILKQENIAAAAERLDKLEKADKPAAGDKEERKDLAERFAALGQKLDQAYRETVAPRLEAIAKLEREANDLEQKAAAAEDAADMRRLKQQGIEFLEKLDGAGLGQLADASVKNGLDAGLKGANGRDAFSRGMKETHAKLVAKLAELLSGDRFASGNEAVPPEYRDLVERYLRTLSSGSSK